MTKQEIALVNDLINHHQWKRGSPELIMLRALQNQPGKKLHKKERRLLNVILNKAIHQQRERTQVEAKKRRNERRENRQLAAIRGNR